MKFANFTLRHRKRGYVLKSQQSWNFIRFVHFYVVTLVDGFDMFLKMSEKSWFFTTFSQRLSEICSPVLMSVWFKMWKMSDFLWKSALFRWENAYYTASQSFQPCFKKGDATEWYNSYKVDEKWWKSAKIMRKKHVKFVYNLCTYFWYGV